MTQPAYAPIPREDTVRESYHLKTPEPWVADRVAELKAPEQPSGPELGVPGPDQGYALLLAERMFEDRLVLTQGITAKDAVHGCAVVASARSAGFGRAPVAKDVELALVLFGFLGEPPADLVEWRSPLFQGAAHDYLRQRRIVDSVRPETLRMTVDDVRARISDWRTLVHAD